MSIKDVYAIASGKGGVGKSSVTVNLAAALVGSGRRVGIIDADMYGHSVPRMLGMTAEPTQSHGKIVPPAAWGISVMSMGSFTDGNAPVVLRGPMLHRVLRQFVSDVDWELDVLLVDLPPGTGDVALSLAELLPAASLLVVTTPQQAAAEVAARAGALTEQTRQRIVGVVENMSWLPCPHCADHRLEVFGSGGGSAVAATLGTSLLGTIPLDARLREQCDLGEPLVHADPDTPAATALLAIARQLATRGGALAGRPLGLTPVLHRG